MRIVLIFLLLISTTSAIFFSFTVDLRRYNESTPLKVPEVQDNSNIYLASVDKALPLSRITLTTKGTSITLDKLLGQIDDHGFKIGWPVSSDLTITSTNSQEVTKALKGYLFVATPTMAQDPNFLVRVVRGTQTLDRSSSATSTIVFLNVFVNNDGSNLYMGFTHTQISNIKQPKTTNLTLYRGNPPDTYGDLQNDETVRRRIFSNPLRISNSDSTQTMFFDNIDPIQYSLEVWMMRAIGGITFDVSDAYVDTTNIQSNSATVTGMSNSQVFTYNSSVTFQSSGNNLGMCGMMIATDLFSGKSITCTLNGMTGSASTTDTIPYDYDNLSVFGFPAENLQIIPSSSVAGSYFIQYFKIDNGPAPTTTTAAPIVTSTAGGVASTSVNPMTSSSVAPVNPASSSTGAPVNPTTPTTGAPQSTTPQSIQTTTRSASMALTFFSFFIVAVQTFGRV